MTSHSLPWKLTVSVCFGRFSRCRPGAPCSSGYSLSFGRNNASIAPCHCGFAVPGAHALRAAVGCGSSRHATWLRDDTPRAPAHSAPGAIDVSGLKLRTGVVRCHTGVVLHRERALSGVRNLCVGTSRVSGIVSGMLGSRGQPVPSQP